MDEKTEVIDPVERAKRVWMKLSKEQKIDFLITVLGFSEKVAEYEVEHNIL